MYPWLLLQLCPVFVAALGTIVSDYNNILLCNSSINKANASGTVTFHSPLDWGNVGSPSYAVTVAQGNNVTQRTIWYDTAGRNYSNDLQIGFDACVSAVYGLPINTIELGQDDPGDCSTVLSQSCREAVTSEIANIATGLTYNGSPGPYSNLSAGSLPYICSDIWNSPGFNSQWPPACNAELGINPSKNQNGVASILELPPLTSYNASYLNSSCTLQSGNSTFYQVVTLSTPGTVDAYTNAIRTIQPMLTVYMPVANIDRTGGWGRANSIFTCIRVEHYYPGSRVIPALPAGTPYIYGSRLSGGAIAGIVVGAVVFCALVALGTFFWLRRKRRIARPRTTADKREAVDDPDAKRPEMDGSQVLELNETDRKGEIDGYELVELGHNEEASELSGHDNRAESKGSDTCAELGT